MAVHAFASTRPVRRIRLALAALVALAAPSMAAAQTTITLADPGTELTDDVTIRGGGYANVSYAYDDTLITKTSDSNNTRRILLKFDTSNTIPVGQPVTKAVLTLTLKFSGTSTPRRLGVYWVNRSFLKNSANWIDYRSSETWSQNGGDLGQMFASADVGTAVGSTVSFDVTTLVQNAVSGTFGTRWTRLALVDTSAPSTESMRQFYSSRATNSAVRPRLVVTYGAAAPAPSPQPVSSGTSATLRVMQYNTHHGVGEDGKYDLNRIADVIVNQNPDVVSLNEVMYNSSYGNGENQPETYKRLLQQKTGQTWYYVYARMDGNWTSTSWAVGDQLLSRIPFTTTTRHELSTGAHAVAQGTIVVNGRTINLFSTHVSWDNTTWRTTETREVASWSATWAENRIVLGDFNTWPGTSDYQLMATPYYDEWAEGVKAGIASSPSGSYGYTHGSSRFDYVYLSKGQSGMVLTKILVPNLGPKGTRPSDHDPVVATFTVN